MTSYPFLDPPTQPGDLGQLGHYRVIDELGRGGMGYVFRAEDAKLKRSVALKVMNQKIAATPHSRRRFIHEARAMAAVHHDNVATIFEVGESKGTPFMAMEMLRGSTLETLNEGDRRLDFEEIIEFARQMARGLSAAHAKGIVHRDIKPANIWIQEESERVKILDFGLALASSPVDHLAGRGAVIGTPGYLSPEQARSEPLDDRSDLYSLGVVLYELCTGQLPIKANSVPGQLISILAHRPIPIGDLNPDIPKPLYDLIHELLRKEPRMRPESADRLVEQLEVVERECHAKSEVAQAINKLQLGLSEVVSKKSDSAIFEFDAVPEVLADPLAATSIAQPAATPIATPSMARLAPGNKAPAGETRTWQTYLPIAAIVAVVLVALPLLTFAFTGTDRDNSTYLVADDPISNTTPQASIAATSAELPIGPGGTPFGSPSRRTEPTAVNSEKKDDQQPSSNQVRNDSSPPTRLASTDTVATSPVENAAPASEVAKSGGERSSAPAAAVTVTVAAAVVTPKREMMWTTISTADGRGADAMVQIKSIQKFGLKPSIGVRTRSEIESNHSYIRFDLAEIEETRPWTESAELVLTVVGDKRPVGAILRVFSVDAGLWSEEDLDWKHSYSPDGLDSFPLLVDLVVDPSVDPRDTGLNVIRISSPELAKAVAESGHDTLTLAVAGSGPQNNATMLRFVSREQSKTAAPRLVTQTPLQPPPQPRSQQRRQGGQQR